MTTTFYPANLQWVGAAKEITYGTPVAAPTFWIPVDNSVKFKQNKPPLVDSAFRGLMGVEYQQLQGVQHETLSYKTYLYMDSIYQHLMAILGNPDTITGSADPYTHKTALYNGSGSNSAQPPSYTLFWFDAAGKCWQIPGCVLGDLKITVKTGALVDVEAQWTGLPSVAIASPGDTPSTSKPFPSWNGAVTIGGTPDARHSEVTFDYKREVEAIETINNSQSPLAIGSFALSVSATLMAIYEGSTDQILTSFQSNAQPPISVKLAPAGDAVHSLTLQHSVCAFDAVDEQGSNKYMEIQSTIKALMNATDALDTKQSPAQAIFLTPASTAF